MKISPRIATFLFRGQNSSCSEGHSSDGPISETRPDGPGEISNPAPIVQPCSPNAEVPTDPANLEPADGKTPSSDQEEHRTERAAIREYSGGQSRDQAEQGAVEETGPCYICHGGRFWVSTYGVIVCERCHPPASGKLVERTITIETTSPAHT